MWCVRSAVTTTASCLHLEISGPIGRTSVNPPRKTGHIAMLQMSLSGVGMFEQLVFITITFIIIVSGHYNYNTIIGTFVVRKI